MYVNFPASIKSAFVISAPFDTLLPFNFIVPRVGKLSIFTLAKISAVSTSANLKSFIVNT